MANLSKITAFAQGRSPVVALVLGSVLVYIVVNLLQWAIIARRRSLFARKHGCKPAPRYPHRDPIGLDVSLENLKMSKQGGFLEFATKRFQIVGANTFKIMLLGEHFFVTREPENMKAILATQFKDFSFSPSRKEALGDIFGHGIFTTDGKEWEASRALLRPSFTRSQVGDIETFDKHVTKLLAKIPLDGSTVDLQVLFFGLTLDSATDFLFGESTDVLREGGSESGERFAKAFTYVTEQAGIRGRAGKLSYFIRDKRYPEEKKFVYEYVGNYVQKAVQLHKSSLNQEKKTEDAKSSRYVFLEHLATTGYSEKKIQDELLNILLAGRDTTASLLSFLFYILARRPDVFEKLRAEVTNLGDKPPTFEEIKSMKYLQYCLNEALRLHPIVPQNARMAVRDTTIPLGGGPDGKSPIFVKAGQTVAYSVYAMQRRKDLYGEDAEEYKPERWEHIRPGWQFLPFNGGPRICIGQQFALTEASYTTIRLLQTFKSIQRRDDSILTEYLTLTAAVRDGVNVALTPA
ncbi:putative cytochrome P450 [Venustampulla echinocandica]|uniref:Putative cytochrome P450 n=1 Tax=Venustampulla echinocandica TaxID=2656787 RepID=A0A370TZ94_9HELO|nr:putative cytochrome P450 [Venustampulla echinocandica]RDL40847.1 putative cytochrome P450 [Venustampulla echinocandica]